jgi:DUF1009 family protein
MKYEFSLEIFKKYSDMKFNENPSGGCRVVLSGQIGRQTDMTKLTVAFRTFAKIIKLVQTFIRNNLDAG